MKPFCWTYRSARQVSLAACSCAVTEPKKDVTDEHEVSIRKDSVAAKDTKKCTKCKQHLGNEHAPFELLTFFVCLDEECGWQDVDDC
mmetsp:Transcript_4976/g.9559  ORF Transcript_4976/g.9559 Transcript_4976/m.9559 type:complete len:87 (+) Transcript_4976:15-275(+)